MPRASHSKTIQSSRRGGGTMQRRRKVRNGILRGGTTSKTHFLMSEARRSLATTAGLKTPSLGFAVPALEPLITSPSSNSNRTRCLRLPLSLSSLSLCPVPCPAGVAWWYGVLGLGAKARSRMYLGSGRWASTILSRGEVCCRRREVTNHLVQASQKQSYLLVEVAEK